MKTLIKNINAFYPEYLQAHSDRRNRLLHFIGATLFFTFMIMAFVTKTWWLAPIAVFVGYILPGIGHKHLQHNNSFRSTKPILCVIGAFMLYIDTLSFRIKRKMMKIQK